MKKDIDRRKFKFILAYQDVKHGTPAGFRRACATLCRPVDGASLIVTLQTTPENDDKMLHINNWSKKFIEINISAKTWGFRKKAKFQLTF